MRHRKWHKPKPPEDTPSFYNTTPEPTPYHQVLMQEAMNIVDSVESEDRLATRQEITRCDGILKELTAE